MNATLHIHHTLRAILSRPQKSDQQSSAIKIEESKHPVVRGGHPEPLPTEILERIIKECSTTKELAALCRTCWFFLKTCQARLYQDITLISRSNRHSLPRFERSLALRQDLSVFVHTLSLIVGSPSQQDSSPGLLYHLDKLPNLKTLLAQGIFIDHHICYSLYSHPRLSAVSFSRCEVEGYCRHLVAQRWSGSSITDLQLHLPRFSYGLSPLSYDHRWAVLIPISLRSLTVSGTDFGVYIILGSMSLLAKDHMLDTLSLTFLPTTITEFLISSTQLRHLTLNCLVATNHPIFSSLPGDALPLLEHYAGPVELCELLIRNRPIHAVGLIHRKKRIYTNGYINIFNLLQLSSVSIRELKVLTDPIGPWLWDVPVTVRHLTFILKKEVFMKCLPALSHLTDLRVIRSVSHLQKENLSREELTHVSGTCPSLREVDLRYERWVMVKPNMWELS